VDEIKSNRWRHVAPHLWQLGFTLLELMMAVGVASLLAALAVPTYGHIMDNLRVSQAEKDLVLIASQVQRYRTAHDFMLPDDLTLITDIPAKDPWGNPYQYLNFNSGAPGVKRKIRKDHNLHPLNTEYDLYSMGPDGKSNAPLTASASRDDILWARDGSFVGRATDF
jgi:general secretion pathway protein G